MPKFDWEDKLNHEVKDRILHPEKYRKVKPKDPLKTALRRFLSLARCAHCTRPAGSCGKCINEGVSFKEEKDR